MDENIYNTIEKFIANSESEGFTEILIDEFSVRTIYKMKLNEK